jgi:Tol biopolymer transport system component
VQQVATGSELQVVPPADVSYQGVTYSPDGNYIYYTTYELKGEFGSLYRVPSLGGTPERILFDIDSGVGMSAAARRIAFVRYVIAKGGSTTSHLFTANPDGSDLRSLASLAGDTTFRHEPPAWSPDGRRLLAALQTAKGVRLAVVSFPAGSIEELPTAWADLNALAWAADGSSLLVSGRTAFPGIVRLWHVSAATGERRELTTDFNSYEGLSVAGDGRTLIAVRREDLSQVYVLEKGELKKVTTDGFNDGGTGLCWSGEDTLLFPSNRTARTEMWRVNADGTGLAGHPIGRQASWPASNADGSVLFFRRQGAIWRWDTAAGAGTELTRNIVFGQASVVSPDGRWVYVQKPSGDASALHRFPIDGGTSTEIYKGRFDMLDALPDGRLVGTTMIAQEAGPGEMQMSVALLSPSEARITPLKDVPIISVRGEQDLMPPPILATPDGKGVSYVDVHDGVPDVWVRSLTDGSRQKITRMNPGMVFNFAWSRQGRLAVAHGHVKRDVVRITLREQ